MMKKNRGQVLAVFILILPVLFILSGLIIDCGYLYIEKRNVDNNIKDVLEYGLKSNETDINVLKNKIKRQLNLNIDDIELIDIEIENKDIEINLEKTKTGIFTVIFSKFDYKVTSHYRGYINKDKIVIRKV